MGAREAFDGKRARDRAPAPFTPRPLECAEPFRRSPAGWAVESDPRRADVRHARCAGDAKLRIDVISLSHVVDIAGVVRPDARRAGLRGSVTGQRVDCRDDLRCYAGAAGEVEAVRLRTAECGIVGDHGGANRCDCRRVGRRTHLATRIRLPRRFRNVLAASASGCTALRTTAAAFVICQVVINASRSNRGYPSNRERGAFPRRRPRR